MSVASINCGTSCNRALSSEQMAEAIVWYSLPSAVQASTHYRCRSSQARLQGRDIAFSAVSSNSFHFLLSASRFRCCRSSTGGASRRVGSERRTAARNSPQRSPRIIR